MFRAKQFLPGRQALVVIDLPSKACGPASSAKFVALGYLMFSTSVVLNDSRPSFNEAARELAASLEHNSRWSSPLDDGCRNWSCEGLPPFPCLL